MAAPRIVGIVGGGIGGLALSQILRASSKANVKTVVFERDAAFGGRDQGYFLGINDDTIAALRPTFTSLPDLRSVLENPANRIRFFSMKTPQDRTLFGGPGDGVFVDRAHLRRALLEGVDVKWNKKFARYDERADGVHVQFADGSTERVDVLVGADGANSAVRRQRAPQLECSDLGITNVAGVAPLASIPRALAEQIDGGLVRWLGRDGHTVMMFAVNSDPGQRVALWVLSYPAQQTDWATLFTAAAENLSDEYERSSHKRQQLLQHCIQQVRGRFSDDIVQALSVTQADARLFGPRQIFSVAEPAVQTQLQHATDTRVYLLGDAAHATTTHRGMGANSAVLDAADMATALQTDSSDLSAALLRYEQTMVKRGCKVVRESTAARE